MTGLVLIREDGLLDARGAKYAVVADEAHKLGMGVTTHSWDAIASATAR